MANSSILLDNDEKTEVPAAVMNSNRDFCLWKSNQLCQWQNCSFRLIL